MHPTSRSERRFMREVSREARRRIMKTWSPASISGHLQNIMWWAGKQAVGHGNRCSCNAEKILKKAKRRRELKMEGSDDIFIGN